MSRRCLPWVVLLTSACGVPEPEQAGVTLTLLRGLIDPLNDPGFGGEPAAEVGSLRVTLVSDTERPAQTLDRGSATPRLVFAGEVPSRAQLLVTGRRSDNDALYSGGRSTEFTPLVGEQIEVTVFLGPIEVFTPLVEPMQGARSGAACAVLGEAGALLVGGFERAGGVSSAASPSVVSYRLDRAEACDFSDDCLRGDEPPPRRDAIAVAVAGGVLHGLGRADDGTPLSTLFFTDATGATVELSTAGVPVTARFGAGAAVLDDGSVLILGGDDGTGPSREVFRLDVDTAQVTQGDDLVGPRSFMGVARIFEDDTLVAGGDGGGGASLDTAELIRFGAPPRLVSGGAFPGARGSMRGGRLRPVLARLPDDTVIIAGGGLDQVEAFSISFGDQAGGFVDVTPGPPGVFLAPAMSRLGGDVLLAGGEPEGTSTATAALFTPAANQVIDGTNPTYSGTWRAVGAASSLRADPCLVEMADGAALLAGGGTNGALAVPGGDNPGTAVLEVLVPAPPED